METSKSQVNIEPSPLRGIQWQSQLQKKLFQDNEQPEDVTQFEENIAETQMDVPTTQEETQPTTQDLKEICSGNFTATSQTESNTENDETDNTSVFQNIIEQPPSPEENIAKMDDEDELFITQILNEDEMEKFKQKFASPVITNNLNRTEDDYDEDDEEIVQSKRQKKRLVFSDDEEDESEDAVEEDDGEESIGLHDEDDETNDDARVVDYDSEENEIVEMDEAGKRLQYFYYCVTFF